MIAASNWLPLVFVTDYYWKSDGAKYMVYISKLNFAKKFNIFRVKTQNSSILYIQL